MVEISRVAHYRGEGLPTDTEVLCAELDDTTDAYFLSPYDRQIPQSIPTVALVVARTSTGFDEKAIDALLAKGAPDSLVPGFRDVITEIVEYPGTEIAFQSSEEVPPHYMAMLAQAAFCGRELTEVVIRGEDEAAAEDYRRILGLREEYLVRRDVYPWKSEAGYIGNSGIVTSFAAEALRRARINRTTFLPDLP